MLPNQVNFRELFSNPGAYLSNRTDQYDSQSNSQLPYSQVDFPDSQDQNSQNSLSNSPGKKFYSRYGGSRGITRQNSQENLRLHLSSAVKLTNQQLQNNIARAKDRDERDLLNSILGTIHESSTEVLAAVAVVRDNAQLSERAKDGQLELCFNKIHETIVSCNKEVMKALEVKDKHKDELTRMRQELLGKETKIADLENQLEATREETNNSLVDKLTKISETHHRNTQDKIKELYKIHKQDLKEFAERQHQSQVTGLKDAQQHLKDLGKIQEIQLRDNNTKLGQKIQQIMHQSKSMNEKLTKDIKENIKIVQKQFKLEVDKQLDKQSKLLPASHSDEHQHKVYRLLEDYKVDLSIKVSEQLDVLLGHHETILTDIIKDCLLAEKDHTEKKYQEMQENIHQRIEEEIKKLEASHKEQLDKVMARLKILAPPTTPKISAVLIPPPTSEQFKEQVTLPIPPAEQPATHNKSGRVLRSSRIAAQSVPVTSSTTPTVTPNLPSSTTSASTTIIPVSTTNHDIPKLTSHASSNAVTTACGTAYVSPSLISKSMFQSSVFSQRFSSALYPSPVATVRPQLSREEPLREVRPKTQCAVAEGLMEAASTVIVENQPDPSLSADKSKDGKGNIDTNYSNTVDIEPASPHSEPVSIQPDVAEEEVMKDDCTEIIDYQPPKGKRKKTKQRKRKLIGMKCKAKKISASHIVAESSIVIANNTEDEEMDEEEIQREFHWEPPSRNATSAKNIPSQLISHNSRQDLLLTKKNNVMSRQGNNQRQRQENKRRQIPRYKPQSKQENCSPSFPEHDRFSFGRTYQDAYSQDIRPYNQHVPVYQRQDRQLAHKTYQNQWSHHSVKPDNIAPQMRSYMYSYSTSMPNQTPSDMYDFNEEDRNPLSYNGTAWKRPRNSCNNLGNSSNSRAKSHYDSRTKVNHDEPDARWQVACQIEGHPELQCNREPFEDLGMIPFEKMSNGIDNFEETPQDQDDYSHSRESSPSLSVTEVFVKRKVKHETKTPERRKQYETHSVEDSQSETGNDFLSNATYQHNSHMATFAYAQKQMTTMDSINKHVPKQIAAAESTNVVTTEMLSMKRSFRHRNGRK